MRRPLTFLIACALTSASAACGGDGSSGATVTTLVPSTTASGATAASTLLDATTTTVAGTTAPATTSTTASCAATGGGTAAVTSPMPSGTMLLTDVEVVPVDDCVDTVTMVFRPGLSEAPGFTLGYERGPFSEAGSGAPIRVRGRAFLVLRLEPAATFDFLDESGGLTYEGPRSLRPRGTNHVVHVRLYDAFEGVVGWIVGLDSRQPFTVETGTSPPSLTISIG